MYCALHCNSVDLQFGVSGCLFSKTVTHSGVKKKIVVLVHLQNMYSVLNYMMFRTSQLNYPKRLILKDGHRVCYILLIHHSRSSTSDIRTSYLSISLPIKSLATVLDFCKSASPNVICNMIYSPFFSEAVFCASQVCRCLLGHLEKVVYDG